MVARFVNHYSLLLLALPIALLVALLLQRGRRRLVRLLSLAGLAGLLLAFPFLFPGPAAGDPQEVERLLRAPDRPLLLELYSNY